MSPAANGKATSPGPMAQTPLLHTKFVVSITGTEVVALAGATKPNPVATSAPATNSTLICARMTSSHRSADLGTGRIDDPATIA
jgi:hypothetical protein